ncbi:uncharacterized protein TRAVEDRAFT_142622 [Trametes versicolor FP-101664 SS1]|uniref:uncharacterized protein n=1 Tax=Trametes versicolor (strain FP-101664) TaxID=717944 RepID=UPI0004624635|nr:uncharacterized protein TRAVEDRAFT_142622 [Trametes versicolor FP-101664 SS1]EIW63655.1 hypothetical protein TRAVEDRAFT_142622 [Trametes versicolor FP-101664 SS1]
MSVSVTRPLMDKTPFPNRVAGGSKTPGLKLSKLALLVPEPEVGESPDAAPLLRPSSTRKSLRGRLSGTFKTPITKGDHWNVSPGDMQLEPAGGAEVEAREHAAEISDADDEMEYMPPSAIERAYEPLFELPDYTNMGGALFRLGHAPLTDDALDVYYAADIEQQVDVRELVLASGPTPGSAKGEELDLSELDDDSPFARKQPKPCPAPTGAKAAGPSARTVANRTAPTGASTRTVQGPSRLGVPQTRASSRTTGTPNSTPVPVAGPAPTRTSVLRAAKAAAASNSATTPHPIRAAGSVSAGARPAPAALPRRPATSLAATKPLVRSATVSGPAKAAGGSAVAAPRTRTTAGGGRARSATFIGPASGGKGPSGARVGVEDDPLAAMLERDAGQGPVEDFLFEL